VLDAGQVVVWGFLETIFGRVAQNMMIFQEEGGTVMDNASKHYRIGDFARKVGVSPDFLKYQEEFGVVDPRQSENSNYRFYAFGQAGRVFASLGYQSLGFTLREIEEIMAKDNGERLRRRLVDKADELHSKITQLEAGLASIEFITGAADKACSADPWFVEKAPDFVFLPHSHGQVLADDERVLSALRIWMEWLPAVSSAQRIRLPKPDVASIDFAWGLLAERNFATAHSLPIAAPAQKVALGRCLVYYQRLPLPEDPQDAQATLRCVLEKALEVARIRNMMLSGEVLNRILFNVHEESVRQLYSVLYLQIV
jgi:DNA-binding transcriptional MerR regulator